jgi:hypothetical protein
MKSTSTSALQIVDETAPASWATAKKLVAQVRAGARAWLELGQVLEELRTEYFADPRANLRRGNSPTPHDAAPGEKGWQAKVREELGISDDTARRWMLDAQRHQQILSIADGSVTQIDGQKITDEVRARAEEALAALQTDPSVRPARQWAGLWGAGATKGKQRAAVDHARNIRRAIIALATSLENWSDLSAQERAEIETGWAELADSGLIPGTWKRP